MIKEYVRFTDIVDVYTNALKNNYKKDIKDCFICVNFIAKRSFEIYKRINEIVNNENNDGDDYSLLAYNWHKNNTNMLFTEVKSNMCKYYELTSIKSIYSDDEFEKLFNYSFYKGILIEFQDFIIRNYYYDIEQYALHDIESGAFDEYLKKQLETDDYFPI